MKRIIFKFMIFQTILATSALADTVATVKVIYPDNEVKQYEFTAASGEVVTKSIPLNGRRRMGCEIILYKNSVAELTCSNLLPTFFSARVSCDGGAQPNAFYVTDFIKKEVRTTSIIFGCQTR